MSLGYTGLCIKIAENDVSVTYSYAGENWNDEKSTQGDCLLQDGEFVILKDCLVEAEIHTKIKKLPSGRKKTVEKRIPRHTDVTKLIGEGKIIIKKECKNAFKNGDNFIDQIAYCLLTGIFERYQIEGILPEQQRFIQ